MVTDRWNDVGWLMKERASNFSSGSPTSPVIWPQSEYFLFMESIR